VVIGDAGDPTRLHLSCHAGEMMATTMKLVNRETKEESLVDYVVDKLTKVTRDIFRAAGASDENNEVVTAALVGANLAGHDSHGVIRIPSYVQTIKRGALDPTARPSVASDRGP